MSNYGNCQTCFCTQNIFISFPSYLQWEIKSPPGYGIHCLCLHILKLSSSILKQFPWFFTMFNVLTPGTWLCCCFRVRFLRCVFLTFFLYLTPCSNDAQNITSFSIPSNIWNISYALVSFVFVRITVLPCDLMISVFSPHSWSFRRTKSFPIFSPLDI